MEILSSTTKQTQELANRVAESLVPGDVIALYGDLGSGKTTFTNHLVKALNIDSRVQSPTFVLMRRYEGAGKNGISRVYHLDLYRLTKTDEVHEIGLFECFKHFNSIVIIEWPELIEGLLPESTIKIKFELTDDDSRKIYVEDTNRFN